MIKSYASYRRTPELTVEKAATVMFRSGNAAIYGLFYNASGTGPFPTVILCHGFPGNDTDVLGLGQRLMEGGFNAMTFNYRGTWGSEGIFSAGNSLEDVISAMRYVKSSSVVRKFCVDQSRISIIGYSCGGGIALLGSLSDSAVRQVVYIAEADLSELGRIMQRSDEFRQFVETGLDKDVSDSGSRAPKAKELFAEVLADIDKYDLIKHAEGLSCKDILIISGWRDQTNPIEHHILPLFRALQKHEAKQVQVEIYDTDHSFGNVRDKLAEKIISWLESDN